MTTSLASTALPNSIYKSSSHSDYLFVLNRRPRDCCCLYQPRQSHDEEHGNGDLSELHSSVYSTATATIQVAGPAVAVPAGLPYNAGQIQEAL